MKLRKEEPNPYCPYITLCYRAILAPNKERCTEADNYLACRHINHWLEYDERLRRFYRNAT